MNRQVLFDDCTRNFDFVWDSPSYHNILDVDYCYEEIICDEIIQKTWQFVGSHAKEYICEQI